MKLVRPRRVYEEKRRAGGGGRITFDAIIFMQIIPDVFAGMGARKMGRRPTNTRTSSLARAIKNDQPTLNLWCTSRTVCKLPRQDRLAVGGRGGGLSYESAPSRFCRLFQMLLHAIRRRFITIRLHLFGTLAIAVLLLRRLVPNYPPKNPFCCRTPIIA